MQSSLRFRVSFVVLLAVLFAANFALSQGIVTGSITGTVEDAQGAVVSNAKVIAKATATNREYTTVTSDSGAIFLRGLPPGDYEVTVESPTFRKYEAKGIVVNVGADTGLGRVKLEIGSQAETVTVEGATPLIETTTEQITNTFETEQVASLPIGNNFDSLTLFAPGVAPAGDAGFSNTNGAGFAVNGQRARDNNFQIDGQNNNDNSIGGPSIFFGNQDAIDQIQVVTQYSAEYGRNSGSIVNYITKAGTNNFHGTGYEFWAGNTFASLDNIEKSPLVNANGALPIPRYVDNRFGGTIGGPIVKDRVWFFGSANFEKTRGSSIYSTGEGGIVPTPAGIAALQADYPGNAGVALLTAVGSTAVPGAVYSNPQFPYVTTVTDSLGNYIDCTATPTPAGCFNNIEFGRATRAVASPYNDYEGTGRVDFRASSKDNVFARYLFQQNTSSGINFGLGAQIGDYQTIPGRSQQIGLDWSRSISNTMINQVRLSFSRAAFYFNEGGFTGCNQSAPLNCPPEVLLLGSLPQDAVSFGVASGFPQGRVINVYQLQDNASKQVGRHSLKFGGEISQQRSPNLFLPNDNGVYFFSSFNDIIANNPSQTRLTQGNPHLPFKEWDLAFYTQDDWRIKDNLTLNLGLRWEWNQQAINLLHQQSVAQQTGPNPFWDPTLPLSHNTVPTVPQDLNNFSPVVGFAWTPRIFQGLFGQDKTVIRGGFRISYDPEFYNMFLNVATSAPSVNAGQFVAPLPNSGFTGADLNVFLAPFVPTGVDSGIRNHTTVAPNFHNPYSEQWNLGVQHSFTSRIVGEVRYVGNHGVGNFQSINRNPALQPLIDNGFANLIPPGLTPCTDPNAPGSNLGYANCNFRRVVERGNFAWSKYNSMQSELRIGQWHGVTATASYTWSHTMDNSSEVYSTVGGGNTLSFSQSPFDTNRAERANSGINFPNLVGIAFVYDIPFAKGRHDFVGKVAGGWQMNTTYRYSTGQPYTPIEFNNFELGAGNLCDPSSTDSGTYSACRPILSNKAAPLGTMAQCDPTQPGCQLVDWVTNAPTTASAVHFIYNNLQAAQNLTGTPYAGVSRNSVIGQAISTANLSIFKNTKLTERVTFQLQAQAFNVFNHQFRGSPDPVVDDIALGTFGNNFSNADAGASSTANAVYDGIGRRRLMFGGKIIF
jgi:hypothetical protein